MPMDMQASHQKQPDITYYGTSKTRQLTSTLAVYSSLCHKDRDVSPPSQGLPFQFFSVLAAFKPGFTAECPNDP